jgi:hypothetical protein
MAATYLIRIYPYIVELTNDPGFHWVPASSSDFRILLGLAGFTASPVGELVDAREVCKLGLWPVRRLAAGRPACMPRIYI